MNLRPRVVLCAVLAAVITVVDAAAAGESNQPCPVAQSTISSQAALAVARRAALERGLDPERYAVAVDEGADDFHIVWRPKQPKAGEASYRFSVSRRGGALTRADRDQ